MSETERMPPDEQVIVLLEASRGLIERIKHLERVADTQSRLIEVLKQQIKEKNDDE